jgi:hypothetical protein
LELEHILFSGDGDESFSVDVVPLHREEKACTGPIPCRIALCCGKLEALDSWHGRALRLRVV